MSNHGKELYEFGPFRLDPGKRLLLRDNQPVPLQLKAFETLLVLVRNSEQVVLKDDLMKAVWPDSFVEESNLTQNIFVLRKTLSQTVGDHRYIITIPGRGYSFTGKVRVVSEEESLVVESHSRTRVVIDEKSFPDVKEAAVAEGTASRRVGRKVALGATMAVLAAAAVAFRPTVPPPTVARIRQLTHIGTLVHNTKLITDGPRIYFRVWEGKDRVVRYVSPEGGEIFPVGKALPNMDIDDISPSGSEFLEVNYGDLRRLSDSEAPYPSLWRVATPSGSPQPVGDLHVRDARWSPDGRTIAYSVGSDLYLVNPDGTNSRKLASLSTCYGRPTATGSAFRLQIHATMALRSGRQTFPATQFGHCFQTGLALDGFWAEAGHQTEGYFFYTVLGDWPTRNTWAIREQETLRRVNPQPMQITAGPLAFYLPSPSKDGKSVFAVGEQLRGQLLRYEAATRQFVPYAQGISADHVMFSRDGQWMAYVEFPEGVLVRSRVDGSERQQLTFPPMRAFSLQWSPDGRQIACEALAQMGAHNKIYLISSSGGVPVLAAPARHDRQTYPSWTADGGSILFSSSDEDDSNPVLQFLDLGTKRVSLLPGTTGLYLAQISPDGRNIAAVEETTRKLMLYNTASHQVRTLANLGDYPRWSADGQYLYFSTPYWNGGVNGGVYRWRVSTNTIETVTRYPVFLLAGVWGVGYGITPEGDTLMLRDVSTRDLYALDVELP